MLDVRRPLRGIVVGAREALERRVGKQRNIYLWLTL